MACDDGLFASFTQPSGTTVRVRAKGNDDEFIASGLVTHEKTDGTTTQKARLHTALRNGTVREALGPQDKRVMVVVNVEFTVKAGSSAEVQAELFDAGGASLGAPYCCRLVGRHSQIWTVLIVLNAP